MSATAAKSRVCIECDKRTTNFREYGDSVMCLRCTRELDEYWNYN